MSDLGRRLFEANEGVATDVGDLYYLAAERIYAQEALIDQHESTILELERAAAELSEQQCKNHRIMAKRSAWASKAIELLGNAQSALWTDQPEQVANHYEVIMSALIKAASWEEVDCE